MATETFQTLKLSDALMAELGATTADFSDKLTALLASSRESKVNVIAAQAAATETASAGVELADRLAALESRFVAMESSKLDSDNILAAAKEAAKMEASATASAILAKSGGVPISASLPAAEAASKLALSRAEFSALNPVEQSRFCLSGGRISENK